MTVFPGACRANVVSEYLYLKFVNQKQAIKRQARLATCKESAQAAWNDDLPFTILHEMLTSYYEYSTEQQGRPLSEVDLKNVLRPIIVARGIVECCSFSKGSGECEMENMPSENNCLCVGYLQIRGGQKTVQRSLEVYRGN